MNNPNSTNNTPSWNRNLCNINESHENGMQMCNNYNQNDYFQNCTPHGDNRILGISISGLQSEMRKAASESQSTDATEIYAKKKEDLHTLNSEEEKNVIQTMHHQQLAKSLPTRNDKNIHAETEVKKGFAEDESIRLQGGHNLSEKSLNFGNFMNANGICVSDFQRNSLNPVGHLSSTIKSSSNSVDLPLQTNNNSSNLMLKTSNIYSNVQNNQSVVDLDQNTIKGIYSNDGYQSNVDCHSNLNESSRIALNQQIGLDDSSIFISNGTNSNNKRNYGSINCHDGGMMFGGESSGFHFENNNLSIPYGHKVDSSDYPLLATSNSYSTFNNNMNEFTNPNLNASSWNSSSQLHNIGSFGMNHPPLVEFGNHFPTNVLPPPGLINTPDNNFEFTNQYNQNSNHSSYHPTSANVFGNSSTNFKQTESPAIRSPLYHSPMANWNNMYAGFEKNMNICHSSTSNLNYDWAEKQLKNQTPIKVHLDHHQEMVQNPQIRNSSRILNDVRPLVQMNKSGLLNYKCPSSSLNSVDDQPVEEELNYWANQCSQMRSRNTLEGTRTAVRRLRKWFREKYGQPLDLNTITRDTAPAILKEFFTEIRDTRPGRTGNEYEPVTLTTYRNGLRRYFLYRQCPPAPDKFDLTGNNFNNLNRCLLFKRDSFRRKNKYTNSNVIDFATDEQVEQMWTSGAIGLHDPAQLLRLLWWVNSMYHGIRGRVAHHNLKIEDFITFTNTKGIKCVKLQRYPSNHENDNFASNFGSVGGQLLNFPILDQTGGNTFPESLSHMFVTGGQSDKIGSSTTTNRKKNRTAMLVESNGDPNKDLALAFEIFKNHRPPGISAFYLTPKNNPNGDIWYNKVPMGKNSIGRIMHDIKCISGLI